MRSSRRQIFGRKRQQRSSKRSSKSIDREVLRFSIGERRQTFFASLRGNFEKYDVYCVYFLLVVFRPRLLLAQGVRSGPDPQTFRDPDLERDSHHNLEVAKNYFKLKKAYVAALKRCEEIIAGNPNFAKIEEVLWMAGQSSLSLAESKGKQSPGAVCHLRRW